LRINRERKVKRASRRDEEKKMDQKIAIGEMQKRHSSSHKESVTEVAHRVNRAMKANKRATEAHEDAVYSRDEANEALAKALDAVAEAQARKKGAHGEEADIADHILVVHKCLKEALAHEERVAKCHKALAEAQTELRAHHEAAALAAEKALHDFANEPAAEKAARRNAKRDANEPSGDPLYDLIQESARSMGVDTVTILGDRELKRKLMAKVIAGQLARPGVFGAIK
jgi:hypothetical protein